MSERNERRKQPREPMPYGQRFALLHLAGDPTVPMADVTAVTWRALVRRGLVRKIEGRHELTDAGVAVIPEVRASLEPRRRRGQGRAQR